MDLLDLAPSLKRAIATPGEFATFFPNTTDDDLAGTLADAVCEAQLDGFLATSTLDIDNEAVTPDLVAAQIALVVFYGMSRMLSAQVANMKNRTRYKAGPVEAETEQSASIVVELMKEVSARKRQFLDDARAGNVAKAFTMVDMYIAKAIDFNNSDAAYLNVAYLDGSYLNGGTGYGNYGTGNF